MNTSIPTEVSVILFYNGKGEILLQDRRTRSKWGEDYGFFGGRVEEGETPEEAIQREIKEELGLEGITFELYRKYTHTNPSTGVKVKRNVYLSDLPDISKLTCTEGKMEIRTFQNSVELKMIPGFKELLQEIYAELKEQSKITYQKI